MGWTRQRHANARSRIVWLALLATFLVALGYMTVYRAAWDDIVRSDYTVYQAAGKAVLDGTNIYQAHNSRGWDYMYPPLFAIAMVPLAKLSAAWGAAIWYLLTIASLGSAIYMCVALAREKYPRPGNQGRRVWILPAVLLSPWLISGVMRAQASEFVTWLMIAALYYDRRGEQISGGISLAFATLIKAFPVILVAYFLLQRRWRFVSAFLLALLVGALAPAAVFGWHGNLDYMQQWHELVTRPVMVASGPTAADPFRDQMLNISRQRNQSLEALGLVIGFAPNQLRTWLAVVASVMFGAMYWVFRRRPDAGVTLAAAFFVWTVLVPPVSESHYFGLLLPPLSLLAAASLWEANGLARWLAAAMLVVFAGVGPFVTIFKAAQMYRPLCWMSLAAWGVLLVLALRGRPVQPSITTPAGTSAAVGGALRGRPTRPIS